MYPRILVSILMVLYFGIVTSGAYMLGYHIGWPVHKYLSAKYNTVIADLISGILIVLYAAVAAAIWVYMMIQLD